MWQQVRQQTFGGVRLHEDHVMWNAGVVGIPAARAAASIALALRLCDDMSRQQVTPRLIEQLALSVALAETGPLQAAAPYIGHYWSTKAGVERSHCGFPVGIAPLPTLGSGRGSRYGLLRLPANPG